MKKRTILLLVTFFSILLCNAQNTKDDDLGAWYMYFFNGKFKNSSFGIQGDVQYRNFNLGGDLEQLLIRTGLTYTPKNTNVILTLGIAKITTGEIGEGENTFNENRLYQEIALPQKIGERFYLNHRFRYEQRFIDDQDFRTRFRYNLFLYVALKKKTIDNNTLYLALYNEIFINGESNIGNNRSVGVFDRNRFYSGLGYGLTDKLRLQLGFMNQSVETRGKDQIQVSIHHNF